MSVDRDGRRGNQDENSSFLFLDVKVLLATTFSIRISFALRLFVILCLFSIFQLSKKADCSLFTLLVGRSVGRSVSRRHH